MPQKWLLVLVCSAALACSADAKSRVRLGGIAVTAGYTNFGGFPFYPYLPFAYDPFWFAFNPYFYPGYFTGFGYQADKGEVKLRDIGSRDATVYLDGAYAGPASKLKSMWLDPGAYNLEIRSASGDTFERRIYVLTGKTLNIRPWEKRP